MAALSVQSSSGGNRQPSPTGDHFGRAAPKQRVGGDASTDDNFQLLLPTGPFGPPPHEWEALVQFFQQRFDHRPLEGGSEVGLLLRAGIRPRSRKRYRSAVFRPLKLNSRPGRDGFGERLPARRLRSWPGDRAPARPGSEAKHARRLVEGLPRRVVASAVR